MSRNTYNTILSTLLIVSLLAASLNYYQSKRNLRLSIHNKQSTEIILEKAEKLIIKQKEIIDKQETIMNRQKRVIDWQEVIIIELGRKLSSCRETIE